MVVRSATEEQLRQKKLINLKPNVKKQRAVLEENVTLVNKPVEHPAVTELRCL